MGAENHRECDPRWGDRDAVDVAGALPVERVADPPAFPLQRRQRSVHLGLRARADARTGSEPQPMAAGYHEADRGQQQQDGESERAVCEGEQADHRRDQRAGSECAGARESPELLPARVANRLTDHDRIPDGLTASRWKHRQTPRPTALAARGHHQQSGHDRPAPRQHTGSVRVIAGRDRATTLGGAQSGDQRLDWPRGRRRLPFDGGADGPNGRLARDRGSEAMISRSRRSARTAAWLPAGAAMIRGGGCADRLRLKQMKTIGPTCSSHHRLGSLILGTNQNGRRQDRRPARRTTVTLRQVLGDRDHGGSWLSSTAPGTSPHVSAPEALLSSA